MLPKTVLKLRKSALWSEPDRFFERSSGKSAEAPSYTDGNVPVQQVVLPKDSVFKIAFTSELSTKMSRKGDVVHFKAADNLYVNDVLVLPKGATGIGEVKKVVQPGIFGKDGRIDIDFTCIYGVDGTRFPLL